MDRIISSAGRRSSRMRRTFVNTSVSLLIVSRPADGVTEAAGVFAGDSR
jgi:hypothetical protein